jgi:hypothetical protein
MDLSRGLGDVYKRQGVCRRFFTEVRIKQRIREFSEQGCHTMDSRYWSFSR